MAKKKFEDNLKRISQIAEILEEGTISLEESLKLYKEASKTAILLSKELEEAKLSVIEVQRELDGSFSEKEVTDEI